MPLPAMERGQSHGIAPTDRMVNQTLFFGVIKFSLFSHCLFGHGDYPQQTLYLSL